MKYLIVGLGNIGDEYENTRHNIGFMVADEIAKRFNASFDLEKQAFCTEVKHKGRTIIIAKPTTYMNLSGKAINFLMQKHKITASNLLVIVDEIALDFGVIRMRQKGSSAGHNGLGNIEHTLGSSQYPRLRFGIGNNFYKGKQVDYVLSDFSHEEMKELPFAIDKAADAALAFCTIGVQRAMNQFNG